MKRIKFPINLPLLLRLFKNRKLKRTQDEREDDFCFSPINQSVLKAILRQKAACTGG